MSQVPPKGTLLGELSLDEVFIRYDGPRLFSCSNSAGALYLGLHVDESADGEVFLYAPLSEDRLAALRSGQFPLRSVFASPPDGVLFVVTTNDTATNATWMRATELRSEWLPEADVHLNRETPTHARLSELELRRSSRAIGRTLAAFELDAPYGTTEFPLRPAGEFMRLVQDSIDAMGQVVRDKKTNRGAVQKDVLHDAELSLYGLRAASFAVVVASSPKSQLFEDPLVPRSLTLITELMAVAENPEELTTALAQLHPRALAKYRDLLEELEDSDTGLTAIIAPPEADLVKASLTRQGVSQSLRLVRRQIGDDVTELTVFGRLIGVNERTFTFEIVDEVTDHRLRGKVAPEARGQLSGLTIGSRYRALVLREQDVVPATGEVRFKYRLLSISAPSSLS